MAKPVFFIFKRISFLCLLCTCFLPALSQQTVNIIPQPNSVVFTGKPCSLPKSEIIIAHNAPLRNEANLLSTYLTGAGFKVNLREANSGMACHIYLGIDSMADESYKLHLRPGTVAIHGSSGKGVFYGIQSLVQLMEQAPAGDTLVLPGLDIYDAPRFAWRGMHLDVCRHFFSKEYVKQYIDILALYKMNTFHWHLTDDQGWRIEIKKHPLLTQTGSVREGSMVGHYSEQRVDTIRYGGFYTQDDIREVVAYAAMRHITIVPEIEMPGHALAALTAYPHLSCTGGPFKVEKTWGVFDDVFCAGNDNTFAFMQDVLDEVCDLFPGKYIHIGGDECPKTRWEKCPKCLARMKSENLTDAHALQSYFIRRIEKHVNAKGRQIIGWDEILEGGLAPNAAVMSWRGTEGGTAAAKEKHFAVMTPGSHCYFDHYQGKPRYEPLAFGGYTPLEKVYSYEPVPAGLNTEEAKYIMGAQANLWTEYITSFEHVQYMLLPRLCALSEVVWTQPTNKDEADFMHRLAKHFTYLQNHKLNFATTVLTPRISTITDRGITFVKLSPPMVGSTQYSLVVNGKSNSHTPAWPALTNDMTWGMAPVSSRLTLETVTKLAAGKGQEIKKEIKQEFFISRATACKITYKIPPAPAYSKDADFKLVDGIKADLPKENNQWLGWNGTDVEMTLDLGSIQKISAVSIGYFHNDRNWIYAPSGISIAVSKDGKTFKEVKTLDAKAIAANNRELNIKLPRSKAQYIKITATNPGKIPAGKPGEGENSWLFFDEILVD